MKKPRLIQDWRRAHRWLSVQAMVLSTAILSAWAMMPADLKARLPEDVGLWAAVVTLSAGVVGRLIDQRPPDPRP